MPNKIVVAMLKDQRGTLVLSTAQDSVADCEAYCDERVINFEEKKEAGARVVQVELRELGAAGEAAGPVEAAQRVASYLKERAAARGQHPDEIAVMNSGSEREASLFTADLQALVDFVTGA